MENKDYSALHTATKTGTKETIDITACKKVEEEAVTGVSVYEVENNIGDRS